MKAQHADAPPNVWHRHAQPVPAGRYEFRVWIEREGVRFTNYIDDVLQALSWTTNDSGLLVGSLTVHKPEHEKFDLHVGDEVTAEFSVLGQARWRRVWRMRLTQPEYQLTQRQYVYQLEDGLAQLSQSKGTFSYRRDKRHPQGWRVDEAIRDVCGRYELPVGRVPLMRHRLRKLHLSEQDPLTVIARLLRLERTATGVRYFLRWGDRGLDVVPFQRSRDLLLLGNYIIEGTVTEKQPDGFATELDLVATKDAGTTKDSKGHKKHRHHKLKTTVRSERLVRRYGVVKRTVHHNSADSVAELRRWGERKLAHVGRVSSGFEFTHPGVPTLRTGDAMRLTVPDAGLERVVCFVGNVAHTVQPGSYDMSVTVQFDDPYLAQDRRRARVARKRAEKARERQRKAPPAHKTAPSTKKASQRT